MGTRVGKIIGGDIRYCLCDCVCVVCDSVCVVRVLCVWQFVVCVSLQRSW